MTGGAGRDDFDDLVLDEDFVRGGRREESADERLERLKRIARENARGEGWRQGASVSPMAPARRRRRTRTAGRALLSLTCVAGVLAGAWYLQDMPGTGSVPDVPGTAEQVAAEAPSPGDGPTLPLDAPVPQRLAALPPEIGGEGGYRFLTPSVDDPSRPVAYDPCRPVRWVVRRLGEPPGGDELLQQAVAEISAATGLVFERGLDTDEAPTDRRRTVQPERYGDDVAPVLVAWSDERASPDLAGYITGVAGSSSAGMTATSERYLTGTVLLDAEQLGEELRRPGGALQVRSTILHELGHLVGLAHVSEREQIMFSEGGDNRLDLGEGDRRGLRLLGDGRCFTDWEQLVPQLR